MTHPRIGFESQERGSVPDAAGLGWEAAAALQMEVLHIAQRVSWHRTDDI